MKTAIALLGLLLASPVLAQEDGVPLLRVYIDTPYYYEFLAVNIAESGGHQRFDLMIEGKEVGAATIDLDCATGAFSQKETDPWTGSAGAFVDAAVMAYRELLC